ncbi:MAG TPA: hypothetical protein VJL59_24710 [Anaerolineales bacterium]|nr:hypothetical protein [Anaerolineales bacterium]
MKQQPLVMITHPLARRRQFVLSVGVLVVAAGLRLWHVSQTPPGLHHDEAFHLLRAQEIAHGVTFPIYITGNFGNEPLFAYLSSITLLILGPAPWAGRLMAAWVGLIGVAATLRLGAEMFPKRGVGLLGGAVLATFYWHLNFSRFGTQPILSAAAAACTMAALWHGARTGNRWAYVLAGLALSLGLDAYVAFRLFPIVPLCAGLVLLLMRPDQRRSLLIGGAVAVGVASLIYSPLALFFIQNPHWFLNRYSQVTQATLQTQAPLSSLGQNALKVAGGLFFQGDPDWKYNLPVRPALDLVQAVFFLLGAGLCVWKWRKPESLTLLVWLVVGLFPSVLTESAPQFGRTVMVTPAIALLIAQGMKTVWQWARGRWVSKLAVGLALAFSAALTTRDYFFAWGQNHNLFIAFDVGLQWTAQQLRAAPPGSVLFETPVYRTYPTFEYTLGAEAYTRFKYFDGRQCFVVPSVTTANTVYAVIVSASEDPFTLPFLKTVFPAGSATAHELNGDSLYAVVYQIPAGQTAQLAIGTPRRVDFGGTVRMLGYTITTKDLKPGSAMRLTATWEAEQPALAAYKIFVHLVGPLKDDGSVIYAQRDTEPCDNFYSSRQWAPGEIIVDRFALSLPNDIPPGDYKLLIGWYDSGTLERLTANDELGRAHDNAVELEQVHIIGP